MEEQKDLVPVAQEILRLIGNNDNVLGNLTIEERETYYATVTDKIIDIAKLKELTAIDIGIVFQLLLQAYESVQTATFNSLNRAEGIALSKYYGKEASEVTVKDIYEKLDS